MRLNRNLILVLVVLVLAGVALVAYSIITGRQAQRVRVVAANIDIPEGKVLSAEMLGAVEVRKPDPGEVAYYVYDPRQVEGTVALQRILAGQPVDSRAIGQDPPPGWPMPSGEVIPPGERGLAIPIDQRLSVGGAVRSGAFLTIYYAKEVDWEAVQVFLDGVAELDPTGGTQASSGNPTTSSAPGMVPAEERISPQVLLSLDTIPYTYDVLYQHIRVVDLRKGPPGGGDSQVRGEAKAGDSGALYMVLDVTDEQAKTILYYLRLGQLDFAIEGEGGVQEGE